jgi:hypothetical protein
LEAFWKPQSNPVGHSDLCCVVFCKTAGTRARACETERGRESKREREGEGEREREREREGWEGACVWVWVHACFHECVCALVLVPM